jgi:hypothetical protein
LAQPSLSLSSHDDPSKKRKRSEVAAAPAKAEPAAAAARSGKLAPSTPLSRLAGEEAPKKKKKRALPTSAEVLGTAGGSGSGMAGEEAEDGEIAWLEYALGRGKWSKAKAKKAAPKQEDDDDEMSDGLDGTWSAAPSSVSRRLRPRD